MNKETILVVDDEEDILELVRYNLSREGYGVLCAASSEEAHNILAAENIDLLIHDLVIHPGRRSVTMSGAPLDLTFTEFQVLAFLARRPGWVFTRTQIVDAVRGDDYPVTDRSVDVQIVGLRRKLGAAGRYIETVRGVGYRFKEKSGAAQAR
jgi:DNA-binding response OmpR family regulator